MIIYEDISNCNPLLNCPVPVVNDAKNGCVPLPFEYVNDLIVRFDVDPSTSNQPVNKCRCRDFYDENGLVRVEFGRILHECMDPNCKFRLIQQGLKAKLKIYYCRRKKMWAVKTMEFLEKGRFICEYTGEIHEKLDTKDDCYIFNVQDNLGDDQTFPLTADGKLRSWDINAFKFGNVGRFINHSCDPNVVPYTMRVGNEPFLRLGFVAGKDILAGVELMLDYGPVFWEAKKISCKCNAKNCLYYDHGDD